MTLCDNAQQSSGRGHRPPVKTRAVAPRESSDFWSHARLFPDTLAVHETGGRQATFAQLDQASQRWLAHFRRQGLGVGDTLAVVSPDCLEVVEVVLAALRGGLYVSLLHPRTPADLLQNQLQAIQARLLLTPADLATPPPSAPPPPQEQAGSLLFLTSGSAGEPRPIRRPLPRGGPERLGRQAVLHLDTVCSLAPRSGAVHLVASPLCYSASLLWCMDQLQLGHTVVLTPGWKAELMGEWVESLGITASLMVPTHFYRLLQLPAHQRAAFPHQRLGHIIHTGGHCPQALKRRMLEWWGPVLYEVYGASEGAGTRATPQDWLAKPGTVGPAQGRVQIRDDQDRPCPPGQIGRVFLQLRPTLQETRPRQGDFLALGDLGYLDQDGYLFLCGREDQLIHRGGVKVYPGRIEAVLGRHPLVADVRVVGRPDPEYGQIPLARVQPLAASPTLLAELQDHCRQNLAPWEWPVLELVSELGRDERGKWSV